MQRQSLTLLLCRLLLSFLLRLTPRLTTQSSSKSRRKWSARSGNPRSRRSQPSTTSIQVPRLPRKKTPMQARASLRCSAWSAKSSTPSSRLPNLSQSHLYKRLLSKCQHSPKQRARTRLSKTARQDYKLRGKLSLRSVSKRERKSSMTTIRRLAEPV